MAYPPSRQMSFRIGITIGDVVERDGDLLGDGVNIAARLEGLAEVGGICISRAVHEQVANKLSVQFSDIGAQEVKNIPTPVHAYMVAMRREDGTYATPQFKKPVRPNHPRGAELDVAGRGDGGVSRRHRRRRLPVFHQAGVAERGQGISCASNNATPVPSTTPVAALPVTPSSRPLRRRLLLSRHFHRVKDSRPSPVPFVTDKIRTILANEYVAAAEPKAFALNLNGIIGLSSSQPNEEAAKSAALELCQKRADSVRSPRKCELYAVGSAVVYPHGRPPVPPLPWIRRDPSTEKPFASKDMPFARDPGKARLESTYVPGKKSKAIAVGPEGISFSIPTGQRSPRSCAGHWRPVAPLPALPAWSWPSTTSLSCRCRRS